MSTKVSIKNFQSIKKVKLDINGFTVIIGKNNIGKSAVIRAIESALTNQTGNEFIRYGEKSTEVKIERDGLDIEWIKGTSANYKVNEKSYSKLNRAIPQPLIDAGFDKMQIGDQRISPIIASQFEPLFLINKHGGVITEVLASLYKIDTLSTADDLCQKALRSQKSLLKTRENDLGDLQEKLEKYTDFDTIKKEVETILKEDEELQEERKKVTELGAYEEELISLVKTIKNLGAVKDLKIPDIKDFDQDIAGIQWLREKCNEFERLNTSLNIFEKIQTVKIPDVQEIKAVVEEVRLLTEWDTAVSQLTQEIEKQKEFLDNFTLDDILADIDNLETLMAEFADIKAIEGPFIETASQARILRDESREIVEKLEEKNKELSEFKVCPTCERPL